MSRHRKRNKILQIFYTNELELDKDKFVLIKEHDGCYSIVNMTGDNRITIVTYSHKDDQYALDAATETLNCLIREI